jgi:hypothetical protein
LSVALFGRNELGVTPQALQIIVRTGGFGEDVDQKVAIVHEYPFSGIIAFDTGGKLPGRFQSFSDLVADGVSLPGIRN